MTQKLRKITEYEFLWIGHIHKFEGVERALEYGSWSKGPGSSYETGPEVR